MSLRNDHPFPAGIEDRRRHITNKLPDDSPRIASTSAWSGSGLRSDAVPMAGWPPSIREAFYNDNNAPSQIWHQKAAAVMGDEYSRDIPHRTVPITSLSFYGRSLECAMPQTQYGIEAFFDDPVSTITPEANANSAADNYARSPDFADHRGHAALRTNENCAQVSVPGYTPTPLQYHLIETKALYALQTHTSLITPPSPQSSQPTSNGSDVRTLDCPICGNQYTGQYASRNLTRHRESKHSPRTSSEGVKPIRCNKEGCDSTFGREDALLVHERRSHPELNTPPAKKRKRMDEA